MEDFNRSNHNDFALSSELKERKFTGIRQNSLTDEQEMWVLGEVVFSVSKNLLALNPAIWEKKYQEYFACKEVESLKKGN